MNSTSIIGTGIVGSYLATQFLDASVFDKARKNGGRTSTKKIDEHWKFDFGATMFCDSLKLTFQEIESTFSLRKFFLQFPKAPLFLPIWDETHFYPESGMSVLSQVLLDKSNSSIPGKKVFYGHHLTHIKVKENGAFILNFRESNTKNVVQVESETLFLTQPIPQILELISESPNSEILNRWKDFLEKFNEYRKTLVSCLYFKNEEFNFEKMGFFPKESIPKITQLRPRQTLEYLSWESFKYNKFNPNDHWLLVQFGEEFSNQNFETWMDELKEPTPTSKFLIETQLTKDLDLPKPNSIWNHRWKYAQNKNPILGKTGSLKFDSPEFLTWAKLCQETNIIPVGDFLFGPRIERQILGLDFLLTQNFLGIK